MHRCSQIKGHDKGQNEDCFKTNRQQLNKALELRPRLRPRLEKELREEVTIDFFSRSRGRSLRAGDAFLEAKREWKKIRTKPAEIAFYQ